MDHHHTTVKSDLCRVVRDSKITDKLVDVGEDLGEAQRVQGTKETKDA